MLSQYFVQWTVLGIIFQFYCYESMGCSERVKVDLLNLKASMQHLNRSALSTWRYDDSDCCRWERVGCDNSTKKVIHIFLNGMITNPLSIKPEEVGELLGSLGVEGWSLNASLFLPFEDLQVLDLSSNFLTDLYGVLKLNNLKALHLQQNLLTRAPIVSALPSLEILDVSHNILEEFPDSRGLCQLRNIEELDLSENRITGTLPQCISNLTSLYFLDLSGNNFEGTIPPIFHGLRSLEYISLSNNYFNGSFSFSSLSNNSKLQVFDLVSSNNDLKIETESRHLVPPFQLKIFRLSNCILNEPSVVIPSLLLNQHDLIVVELSHIAMRGKAPTWLLVNNTRLEILNLAGNFLTGPLELNSTSKFLKLTWFDVSDNGINGELPHDIGCLIPNLVSLNMSRNELQGSVPASLGEMKILKYLDLSSNHFSGPLQDDLITECISTSLRRLSDNSLSGLLTSESNLTELYYMFLDNNLSHTDISNGLLTCSRLSYLDISHNFLSGNLPNWIGNFPRLNVLILSNNNFVGPIPTSLCNLTELNWLDLSYNRFNHTLPPCVSLPHLEYLHLQNNELTGPVPNVLSQASALRTLDLSDNKLSGEIPSWISSLPNLSFLLLKGNFLEGPIPFQLCQPHNITMLDLSHNQLSGEIPPCLRVAQGTNSKSPKSPLYGVDVLDNYSLSSNPEIHYDPFFECIKVLICFSKTEREEEIEFLTKNRFEHYKGYILTLMSGVDLSCNDLTGSIPSEIGYLSDVHSLNLSRNNLTGPIPETFSALKQIECLDLSHNKLSGQIPSQLIDLTSLSFFSVAHNNLSGMTPKMINQFGTFENGSYEGNPLLCGPPLVKTCTYERLSPLVKTWLSKLKEDNSMESSIFASFAGSFIVAFFSVIGFLYLNSYYTSETYIPSFFSLPKFLLHK